MNEGRGGGSGGWVEVSQCVWRGQALAVMVRAVTPSKSESGPPGRDGGIASHGGAVHNGRELRRRETLGRASATALAR